jgi:hypothetical protein
MLTKGNSWGGCQVAPSNQKTEKKNRGEEKEFAEKRKGAPWARKTKNVKKLRVKSVC